MGSNLKIPGMSYTVTLTQAEGRHKIEVLLKENVVATANLTAYSKEGVRSAFVNALKDAEINLPVYTIDDLVGRLYDSSGYLEGAVNAPKEVTDAAIMDKLNSIEKRLANIEKKLGI